MKLKLPPISLALTNLEAHKCAKSQGRVRPFDLKTSRPLNPTSCEVEKKLSKDIETPKTSRPFYPTSCKVEEKLSKPRDLFTPPLVKLSKNYLKTLRPLYPIYCKIEEKLSQYLETLSLFTPPLVRLRKNYLKTSRPQGLFTHLL